MGRRLRRLLVPLRSARRLIEREETPVRSSFLGFVKRAECPACGTLLTKNLGESWVLCSKCGDYSSFEAKTLRRVDRSLVRDVALFAAPTPWPEMQAPLFSEVRHPVAALTDMFLTKSEGVRLLDAKWPEGCCVCGKPSTREETISQQLGFSAPSGGASRQKKEATVVARGIPHCAEHEGGARFERLISFGDEDLMILGLFFRSYPYQIRFRKLNPWKWRA